MSKMKWVKEISDDPNLSEVLFKATQDAEQSKRTHVVFQAERLTISMAKAMCAIIKEETIKDDSYDREGRL